MQVSRRVGLVRDKDVLASDATVCSHRAQAQRKVRRGRSSRGEQTVVDARLRPQQWQQQVSFGAQKQRRPRRPIEQARHGLLESESGLLSCQPASSVLRNARSSVQSDVAWHRQLRAHVLWPTVRDAARDHQVQMQLHVQLVLYD